MENRGTKDPTTEELCIIQHGDTYEWAVVTGGFIYPTCVQSGSVTSDTTSLVPNSPDGSATNLGKQANQLDGQRVFERNNYLAVECPAVVSYCRGNPEGFDTIINQHWRDQVSGLVTSYGGSLDENWDANVCMGDDNSIRYVTATEIVNTCTGFLYRETSEYDARTTTCGGVNNWECGFKTFSPFTFMSPGWYVNEVRAIARALSSEGYQYPECSFNNNNYCQVESQERREQPRYADKTNCVDSSHPQYDPSLEGALGRIVVKAADSNTYDLCYMADEEDDLQYVIFVNGVGYPTCVQAPTDAADCRTDKFWCVEEERKNWPNTVAARLLAGKVYGADSRANHQHHECPDILDICLPEAGQTSIEGGLTSFDAGDVQPQSMPGAFDNNICRGRNGGVRVVTADGILPTCTSYIWNTDTQVAGQEQKSVCPIARNFMCGSLQNVNGQKTVGWLAAQAELVRTALVEADFMHPDCPYNECREC